MPQIILYERKIIFFGSLLHKKPTPWVLGCHTSQHIIYNIVGDGVHDTHIMFELRGVVWWQVQDIPRSDPAGDRYIKGYRPVCSTPPSGPPSACLPTELLTVASMSASIFSSSSTAESPVG